MASAARKALQPSALRVISATSAATGAAKRPDNAMFVLLPRVIHHAMLRR